MRTVEQLKALIKSRKELLLYSDIKPSTKRMITDVIIPAYEKEIMVLELGKQLNEKYINPIDNLEIMINANNIQFEIEELVYLKTDSEQKERLVTGLQFRKNLITYGLSCGTEETWHYDFEITKDRNIIKATTD